MTGSATDRAGNSATVTVEVKIDKTSPLVTITSPAEGAVVYENQATVSGSITDTLSGPGSVVCGAVAAVVSGNSFSCDVPLTGVTNAITVTLSDQAGNSASASVTVEHVIGARIEITSPQSLITVGASD